MNRVVEINAKFLIEEGDDEEIREALRELGESLTNLDIYFFSDVVYMVADEETAKKFHEDKEKYEKEMEE